MGALTVMHPVRQGRTFTACRWNSANRLKAAPKCQRIKARAANKDKSYTNSTSACSPTGESIRGEYRYSEPCSRSVSKCGSPSDPRAVLDVPEGCAMPLPERSRAAADSQHFAVATFCALNVSYYCSSKNIAGDLRRR